VIALFSLILSSSALAAGAPDIAGEYVVSGWDPGHSRADVPDYKGWVELTAWGQAWKYRGFMDGMSYVGVGILDAGTGTLSLSFRSEDGAETGVTMLKMTGDGFDGQWVFAGSGDGVPGCEIWARKR
jgi:hypothetical protein